jgi:hypothetical protein
VAEHLGKCAFVGVCKKMFTLMHGMCLQGTKTVRVNTLQRIKPFSLLKTVVSTHVKNKQWDAKKEI